MKISTYLLLIGLLPYGVSAQTSTDVNVKKTTKELTVAKAAFEKASKEVTAYFEAKKHKKKAATVLKKEPLLNNKEKVKPDIIIEEKKEDLAEFKDSDEGITADFTGHSVPIFCFVKEIDYDARTTVIGFKNDILKDLRVANTLGGTLKKIKIKGFKTDLLLFEGEIEDPKFVKYHLFIVKNNTWVPVIDPFTIHENHLVKIEKPIWANPQNPSQLIRCYSVFDLENQNKGLPPWKLLTEKVAIINK